MERGCFVRRKHSPDYDPGSYGPQTSSVFPPSGDVCAGV